MLSKVVNELLSKISQLIVGSKGEREAQKFLKRVECKLYVLNNFFKLCIKIMFKN